jgi:RNA recognition motif-containing protein
MGLLPWISSKHSLYNGVKDNRRMSFTVFLGNLPAWVTADDIKGWLTAENLVADAIKVIRNPETQESKGFAFIDAPNTEEMNAIIKRFDRAPLEDRLLRANPAQPPKSKTPARPAGGQPAGGAPVGGHGHGAHGEPRAARRHKKSAAKNPDNAGASAFAEELAKAL